jgi:hypothetical protein
MAKATLATRPHRGKRSPKPNGKGKRSNGAAAQTPLEEAESLADPTIWDERRMLIIGMDFVQQLCSPLQAIAAASSQLSPTLLRLLLNGELSPDGYMVLSTAVADIGTRARAAMAREHEPEGVTS